MKLLRISLLSIILSASASLAEQSNCVCDCVYVRSEKIKNHNYFESDSASCSVIEGKACIGNHRGETFRGTVRNCEAGPRVFADSPLFGISAGQDGVSLPHPSTLERAQLSKTSYRSQ